MKIALDAMGGDLGAEIAIQGALVAIRTRTDLEVVLIGPKEDLQQRLTEISASPSLERITICHASEIITMDDIPVESIRKKKEASIMIGFDLVKNGQADAVVSAGNSGATMAAAVKKLGRLPGIARPGIASFFPTLKDPVMLMDIGANVDCRAQHLYQFAAMGAACSRVLLKLETPPRIGLLSIGAETNKGNALVKETYELLKKSPLNFIGNVEGRDVYRGDVDVIVCDGFVGNICLKISEGLADAAMQMLKHEIMKTWRAKLGFLLSRQAFAAFKKKVDYAEYGGAPLLGIKGTSIICHGASDAVALANALGVAAAMVRHRVNDAIVQSLSEFNA